jgi:SAM-dependent methyltransferase
LGFEGLLERRSAAEYADFVLPWIGRGDRVIDVGCGPGSITVGLARVAGHVTGVDVDEAEFTDARAYTAKHGIENVEFLEGSIYELDFPDASFDMCTLFIDDGDAGRSLAGSRRRCVAWFGLEVGGASSIEYGADPRPR